MNPHLCRIALRPRDPAEVLDLSFRVIRDAWRPIARMSAILLIAPWLLCCGLCWGFEGHPAIALIPLALSPLVQAPFTVLVGRLMFAPDYAVRQVLRDVVAKSLALVAAWIAGGFAWCAVALTCGLALPLAEAYIVYLNETTLLERVSLQRALTRSQRLSGAHPAIAIAGVLSWWILTIWGGLVGEFAWQGIIDTVFQLGTPFGALTAGQVTPGLIAGLLLAQPLHAIYRLLLYVDVRTRNEGWDLQVALRAAGMPR